MNANTDVMQKVQTVVLRRRCPHHRNHQVVDADAYVQGKIASFNPSKSRSACCFTPVPISPATARGSKGKATQPGL
jgi:hypothetical protein